MTFKANFIVINTFYHENLQKTTTRQTRRLRRKRSAAGIFACYSRNVAITPDHKIEFYIRANGGLVNAKTADNQEIWVPIIERAFVEVRGSFAKSKGGSFMEAYSYLLPPTKVNNMRVVEITQGNQITLNNAPISRVDLVYELQQAQASKCNIAVATRTATELTNLGFTQNTTTQNITTYISPNSANIKVFSSHGYALDSISNTDCSLLNPHGTDHLTNIPIAELLLISSRITII